MKLSSRLIENAVEQMSSLPGVGQRTALRFVMHLLKKKPGDVEQFAQSLQQLVKEIKTCRTCHNLCESEECEICTHPGRDPEIICVVEDIRDLIAIENTHLFKGKYHVLGGIISPMDGIGPSDLQIESLVNRVQKGMIKEVIMALDASMEGETTSFFIYKKLSASGVKITNLSRGISFGDQLEYADEITLGRSLVNRTPYQTPSV